METAGAPGDVSCIGACRETRLSIVLRGDFLDVGACPPIVTRGSPFLSGFGYSLITLGTADRE